MNTLVSQITTTRGITPSKIQQPLTRGYRGGRGSQHAPELVEALTDWLQSCPEKDYFVAVESESTDSL